MRTKELLDEALEKHRTLKKNLLDLTSRISQPNITKDKIKDELFKIYLELK